MSNKSVLIIPTPQDCEHCDLPFTIDEILGRVVCWEDEYGKHCPLRPLPKPRQLTKGSSYNPWTDENAIGFNECLAEILGETE